MELNNLLKTLLFFGFILALVSIILIYLDASINSSILNATQNFANQTQMIEYNITNAFNPSMNNIVNPSATGIFAFLENELADVINPIYKFFLFLYNVFALIGLVFAFSFAFLFSTIPSSLNLQINGLGTITALMFSVVLGIFGIELAFWLLNYLRGRANE